MGADIEGAYYAGEPLQGNKIERLSRGRPTSGTRISTHTFVNDTHNMRASEFPGKAGGLYTMGSPIADQWKGTPTVREPAGPDRVAKHRLVVRGGRIGEVRRDRGGFAGDRQPLGDLVGHLGTVAGRTQDRLARGRVPVAIGHPFWARSA